MGGGGSINAISIVVHNFGMVIFFINSLHMFLHVHYANWRSPLWTMPWLCSLKHLTSTVKWQPHLLFLSTIQTCVHHCKRGHGYVISVDYKSLDVHYYITKYVGLFYQKICRAIIQLFGEYRTRKVNKSMEWVTNRHKLWLYLHECTTIQEQLQFSAKSRCTIMGTNSNKIDISAKINNFFSEELTEKTFLDQL